MFSKKRNDHSGAKTVTRSRKKAITRFSQWIWSVRLWPSRSKPLTMSASRILIGSLAIKTSVRGTRRVDKSRPVGFRRGGCARRRAILPLPKQTASRLLVQGRFSDLVAEQDDRPGAEDRGTSPDECDGHPRWVGKRNRERGAKNDEGEHDETRPVELAPEAQPHCNLGSHLFALLRAGGGQLRVHPSRSHRGGLQLSNLNALRSDVRYLANSALPTVIGLNRLGLDGGPLRSPIIHHGSASV